MTRLVGKCIRRKPSSSAMSSWLQARSPTLISPSALAARTAVSAANPQILLSTPAIFVGSLRIFRRVRSC
jgi:hypothetical protein